MNSIYCERQKSQKSECEQMYRFAGHWACRYRFAMRLAICKGYEGQLDSTKAELTKLAKRLKKADIEIVRVKK